MNKLQQLIEAAKAAGIYEMRIHGTDLLELCALLEKAEWSLISIQADSENGDWLDEFEVLEAIKQWREQT